MLNAVTPFITPDPYGLSAGLRLVAYPRRAGAGGPGFETKNREKTTQTDVRAYEPSLITRHVAPICRPDGRLWIFTRWRDSSFWQPSLR